jgi:hypothetical protein
VRRLIAALGWPRFIGVGGFGEGLNLVPKLCLHGGLDLLWRQTRLSECPDAVGRVPFGEALASGVGDEAVVVINRLREVEEFLKNAVNVGRGEEVVAAGDIGDLLEGVIDHHGKMIGRRDAFAREHDVSEDGGIDADHTPDLVMEKQGAGEVAGALGIQSPAMGLAGLQPCLALAVGNFCAGARIERAFAPVRSIGHLCDLGVDFPSGAEAWIDDLLGPENLQGLLVGREAFALSEGGLLPLDSHPGQILLNLLVELRAHASVIDVFEAEQMSPMVLLGETLGKKGSVGVTEVEFARRTGGKAGHNHGRI